MSAVQGFRKYERIRETLIHELAHNEFSEHGADFKELNSRLGRECAAINARCVRACVCACVCACVPACVGACRRVWARSCVLGCVRAFGGWR